MAWIPDDSQSFTITLVGEGFLSITNIDAPSTANVGESILVNLTFKNTGTFTDNFS